MNSYLLRKSQKQLASTLTGRRPECGILTLGQKGGKWSQHSKAGDRDSPIPVMLCSSMRAYPCFYTHTFSTIQAMMKDLLSFSSFAETAQRTDLCKYSPCSSTAWLALVLEGVSRMQKWKCTSWQQQMFLLLTDNMAGSGDSVHGLDFS